MNKLENFSKYSGSAAGYMDDYAKQLNKIGPVVNKVSKFGVKTGLKIGSKALGPVSAVWDVYSTVKNPDASLKESLIEVNPVRPVYQLSKKIPVVKELTKENGLMEKLGSKIFDITNKKDSTKTSTNIQQNKVQENTVSSTNMQQNKTQENNNKIQKSSNLPVLGAALLAGTAGSILAYKLYKKHKEKKKTMNKSFNDYNTLAGKMHNFNGLGTVIKGLYQLGKNTLKAGAKNRYTKSGIKKTSMVGADGKPIYDVGPDTLNMANIGKDAKTVAKGAGYTALGAGAAYGGYKGLEYVADKASNAMDTATDYKDALLLNKETKNKNINNSAAGLKLAGAGVVGAMTGGLSGAVLTPLGGYLGRSYGPAGELLGGAAGLVGGAVMDKYLKRLKERQKELKLQESK